MNATDEQIRAENIGGIMLQRQEWQHRRVQVRREHQRAQEELKERYRKDCDEIETNLLGCSQKLRAYGICLEWESEFN